jgi:YHS domain-containing protein
MSLTVAVIASLLISAVSGGVGWYLRRYNSAVTEMLGMMIGMTFGMMTGIVVGYYIGTATDMFVSNLVGVLVGLGFGVVFGRAGGLMGMMDGGMGGMMGGMMGAMLGVMVNNEAEVLGILVPQPVAVGVTAVLMIVLYLVSLVALVRLVQRTASRKFALDPVCNMAVEVAAAQWTSDYQGKTIYFCAPACKRDFDRNPAQYMV